MESTGTSAVSIGWRSDSAGSSRFRFAFPSLIQGIDHLRHFVAKVVEIGVDDCQLAHSHPIQPGDRKLSSRESNLQTPLLPISARNIANRLGRSNPNQSGSRHRREPAKPTGGSLALANYHFESCLAWSLDREFSGIAAADRAAGVASGRSVRRSFASERETHGWSAYVGYWADKFVSWAPVLQG